MATAIEFFHSLAFYFALAVAGLFGIGTGAALTLAALSSQRERLTRLLTHLERRRRVQHAPASVRFVHPQAGIRLKAANNQPKISAAPKLLTYVPEPQASPPVRLIYTRNTSVEQAKQAYREG